MRHFEFSLSLLWLLIIFLFFFYVDWIFPAARKVFHMKRLHLIHVLGSCDVMRGHLVKRRSLLSSHHGTNF